MQGRPWPLQAPAFTAERLLSYRGSMRRALTLPVWVDPLRTHPDETGSKAGGPLEPMRPRGPQQRPANLRQEDDRRGDAAVPSTCSDIPPEHHQQKGCYCHDNCQGQAEIAEHDIPKRRE